MNVLVTGSAGFVGSDLIPRLQRLGHSVAGIDLQPDTQADVSVQHDLREQVPDGALRELAPELCVHLASAVGGFLYNVSHDELPDTQRRIDEAVIALCHRLGCRRLVFTSTINVFEVSGGFEHAALRTHDQRSPYAIAKAQAEARLQAAFPDLMVLRPTNLYGRAQPRRHAQFGESHVIPDFLAKLAEPGALEVFGDGSQRRNFVHVSDLTRFICAQLGFRGQHFINLRSELTLSIQELATTLMELRGEPRELRYRPEFMRHELFELPMFDLEPAERAGWAPRIHRLAEGLAL